MTKEYNNLKKELVLEAFSSLEKNKYYQITLPIITRLTYSSSDSVTKNLLEEMNKEKLIKLRKINRRWCIMPLVEFSKDRKSIIKEMLELKRKEGYLTNTFIYMLDELDDKDYINYFKLLALRWQWKKDEDKVIKYFRIYPTSEDLKKVINSFELDERGRDYYNNLLHQYKNVKEKFLNAVTLTNYEDNFDDHACFDETKGLGRYLDGWNDAMCNIVHLIENEYDIHEIERFCRNEYENREG